MRQFHGDVIIALRKKHKFSQKELAALLGISDRAISKWETGLCQPSAKHMIDMAKLFGVSVEAFYTEGNRISGDSSAETRMESIKELYKIGRGPSSSHTIGPERACRLFRENHPDADEFHAILYGSLAKTGRGHGTDAVIRKTFLPIPSKVLFEPLMTSLPHPNTMDLIALKQGRELGRIRVMSVGGGSIAIKDRATPLTPRIYRMSTFSEIAEHCRQRGIRLWQYVEETESSDFYSYMESVWESMKQAIRRGLEDEGILPGGLNVQKKAKSLFNSQHIDETAQTRENRMVCAYAYAVSEQNAQGETIVTAPTCGASGVLPAVLYYQQQKQGYSDRQIIRALETAGLIGTLIKTNASISGAECGCQAEIGSACAMASAALAELFELSLDQIEYAAEIAIEHHLGLTCDPICGLVQIPCIERNAVAAMRAINAVSLASFLWDSRRISFDKVVHAMKETGRDLLSSYRETSEAGLAKIEL